jgi:hypothetical protein
LVQQSFRQQNLQQRETDFLDNDVTALEADLRRRCGGFVPLERKLGAQGCGVGGLPTVRVQHGARAQQRGEQRDLRGDARHLIIALAATHSGRTGHGCVQDVLAAERATRGALAGMQQVPQAVMAVVVTRKGVSAKLEIGLDDIQLVHVTSNENWRLSRLVSHLECLLEHSLCQQVDLELVAAARCDVEHILALLVNNQKTCVGDIALAGTRMHKQMRQQGRAAALRRVVNGGATRCVSHGEVNA